MVSESCLCLVSESVMSMDRNQVHVSSFCVTNHVQVSDSSKWVQLVMLLDVIVKGSQPMEELDCAPQIHVYWICITIQVFCFCITIDAYCFCVTNVAYCFCITIHVFASVLLLWFGVYYNEEYISKMWIMAGSQPRKELARIRVHVNRLKGTGSNDFCHVHLSLKLVHERWNAMKKFGKKRNAPRCCFSGLLN